MHHREGDFSTNLAQSSSLLSRGPSPACRACFCACRRASSFALCECSKYFFYLQYESGSLYKPASRDFELELASEFSEVQRLAAIWTFWERDEPEDVTVDDGLHPDHAK